MRPEKSCFWGDVGKNCTFVRSGWGGINLNVARALDLNLRLRRWMCGKSRTCPKALNDLWGLCPHRETIMTNSQELYAALRDLACRQRATALSLEKMQPRSLPRSGGLSLGRSFKAGASQISISSRSDG